MKYEIQQTGERGPQKGKGNSGFFQIGGLRMFAINPVRAGTEMADFREKLSSFELPDTRKLIEGTNTQKSSSNLLSDAYDFVCEHPVETTVAATAAIGGGLYLLSRGRMAAAATAEVLPKVEGAAAKIKAGATIEAPGRIEVAARMADAAPAEFKAASGSMRTLEGKAIPNIDRAQLAEGALVSGERAFLQSVETAKSGYLRDVDQIWRLPRSIVAGEGATPKAVAEQVLQTRAVITGEKVTADSIAKETTRLTALNGGILPESSIAGQTIRIYDGEALARLSGDLQFKHVPPLGQFLKGTGRITEAQIDEALRIQKAIPADQPRKLIGQILVENKLAVQADVDLAFSRQQLMKSELRGAIKSAKPEIATAIEAVSKGK